MSVGKGAADESVDVVVKGALSRSVVRVGDPVRFWLTVHNRSPKPIFELRLLQLNCPGYDIGTLCWCGGLAEGCWSLSKDKEFQSATASSPVLDRKPCDLIAAELKRGQTITVWGDLRASESRETYAMSAVVGWTRPDKTRSQLAVPLGQSLVQTKCDQWLSSAREWLKDFAWPLILGVLAVAFPFWARRREQREETRAKEVERVRQEQDRDRAQLVQTWNKMLPQSHKLATQHYMPIEGPVRAALEFMVRHRDKKEEDRDHKTARRAFYNLLLFERRVRHMADSVGGFYFKDRMGEELAVNCYDRYDELYAESSENVRRDLSEILDWIERQETFNSFLRKLDGHASVDRNITEVFQRAWEYFLGWLGTDACGRAISCLKGFRAVVEYEMNRPYEYWYGRPEKLLLDQDTESLLRSIANDIGKESDRRDFPAEVEKYLSLSKG